MGFPLPPNVPQLMVALKPLAQAAWAGRLPNVTAGEAFWAAARDVAQLTAGGWAQAAPPGTPAPPPEPPHTVHGTPGVGAGTSNSSP
jgi:hypothetical protein